MHLHLRQNVAALVAGVALAVPMVCAGSATASPFGTQSPLGSLTESVSSVERPAIAGGTGRSLVVWREQVFDGKSVWRIGGRFVDGSGAPIGDAFEIGFGGFSRPSPPDVTYNAARDEYLVVCRAGRDPGVGI